MLILIMTGLMDLFRRRPVWAGASAPPGTGPASARAPKLRCARAVSVASRRTRRPAEPGIRPAARDARVPAGRRFPAATQRTGGPVSADSRRRSTRTLSKHHRTHPARAPYHHSARPGGPAPIGLCTATRNACSAIQNRAERRFRAAGCGLGEARERAHIDHYRVVGRCALAERCGIRCAGTDLSIP